MSDDVTDAILKIIILGSSEVGKTSILHRYFSHDFKESNLSTVGIDFKSKFFKFDTLKVKVNYIDTAGQEKFRAISENYLKGADGAILTYDITNKESFELLQGWINDIAQYNKGDIGKILLGNKTDLEDERTVTKEDAIQLAKEIGCENFEGSAKTGDNINEALDYIAQVTFENWKLHRNERERRSIRISSSSTLKTNPQEKKKCC